MHLCAETKQLEMLLSGERVPGRRPQKTPANGGTGRGKRIKTNVFPFVGAGGGTQASRCFPLEFSLP